MVKSISNLLRETADRLDALNSTGTPASSLQPSSAITSPRDPVDAEMARLFLPYQRSSRSLTPRHRPIPRTSNPVPRGVSRPLGPTFTYSHIFCCLSSKSTTMAPTRYQKAELANAGLGEKLITFQGQESCPEYFKQGLIESYPKLSEGGGFELLRIRGASRSRELFQILCPNTGYSVKFLKSPEAMIAHVIIYIRPLQRSLNMDKNSESSDTAGPLITCLSCGEEFKFAEIKSHSDTCSRPEAVAAEVQTGSASVGEDIAAQLATSPGLSEPLIEMFDLNDSEEGCSFSKSGNDWKKISDPLQALKLFRESVVKGSGEELHFTMDLRDTIEAREQTIISFYKRPRVDWTAPLNCTLEGDAAIGDGVKRHCLSTIMSKLQFGFEWKIGPVKTLLFEGEKGHLVPSASQVIVSDLFLVAGRMIGHSFLHNGPCLTGLSQAVVHVLGGGMPETASIDIEDCCDTDVREAVALLKGSTELTEDQKRSIQSLAFGWDLPGVTPENRRWLTEKIPFHAVLTRSKKQIKQLRKGLKETRVLDLVTERPDTIPLLFPRSSVVLHMPQQILDSIIWPGESNSDDEDDDTSLEDKCRISGFLRTYIENAADVLAWVGSSP